MRTMNRTQTIPHVRHNPFRNVLYGTSLAGILAGCSKEDTSCDSGYVYDGENCVEDDWQWGERYSFRDVRNTCTSLAALDSLTFCKGLEMEGGYSTCISFYDTFKDDLQTTAASFDGSTTDVYVANYGFSYETPYGTYEGKVPTITFNQDNLLLSCQAYHITDGYEEDSDHYFLSTICHADTFQPGNFLTGSCVLENLPSLTLMINSSKYPGLSYGVTIHGDSFFSTETLTSDQVLLHEDFSEILQEMVCASNDYLDSPELCRQ